MGWKSGVKFLVGAGTSVFAAISCSWICQAFRPVGTGSSFWGIRQLGRECDTHFHLVLRLRMCGAVSPHPHMSSCYDRDNFIFTEDSVKDGT